MENDKSINVDAGTTTQSDANNVLAADADYWITASKEEVRKYLKENTNIEEYEQKKKQILCKIQKKVKHLGQ